MEPNADALKLEECSAEMLKEYGNKEFANKNYSQADKLYTMAIEKAEEPSAIYYTNRATARFHLDYLRDSIEDCGAAISADPSFYKAYYRRAECLMVLGDDKRAMSDYRQALALSPGNRLIDSKLKFLDKKIRSQFQLAIRDKQAEPEIEDITITLERFKEIRTRLKYNNLPFNTFMSLLHATSMNSEPSVIVKRTNNDLTLVGDIHGQLFDLMNIFETRWDKEPDGDEPLTIFLGDYVDRRDHGVGVLQLLLSLKLLTDPKNLARLPEEEQVVIRKKYGQVVMIRGNHESEQMNLQFGFVKEVQEAYKERSAVLLREVYKMYSNLPLACIVNEKIFCTHGGIPVKARVNNLRENHIESLNKIQKRLSYDVMAEESDPYVSAALEMLWNDPAEADTPTTPEFSPSPRGCGCVYGSKAFKDWMLATGMKCVFRAHQVVPEGYREDFVDEENKLKQVTVFSCPNYCGSNNKGTYVRVRPEHMAKLDDAPLQYEVVTIFAQPDPLANKPMFNFSQFFR